MQKSILLMDNVKDFLDVQARLLEQAGYQVFQANSVVQAEAILQQKYVHLAILDIRMEDEEDEQDISGLTLAQKPEYRPVPKIILTAYPSYEAARQALGPALDGLPPAVNFIGKAEGPKAMLEAVKRVFDQHVRINCDLTIRWAGSQQSFWILTGLLNPTLDRTQLPDRTDELENLFRSLFHDSRQITIGRSLLQREGQIILEVFTYGEDREKQFIVSCGWRHIIKTENAGYDKHVPKTLGPGSTVRYQSAETIHFAATAYVLTGANLEEIVPLAEFYAHKPPEAIVDALESLYGTTLALWYQGGRFRDEEKILREWAVQWPGVSDEALSYENLELRIQAMCQECVGVGLGPVDYLPHTLTFHLPNGISELYPNPVSYLADDGFITDVALLCGTIHCRIDKDTILADNQGRIWLIDFYVSTRGPLLRDFVSLETSVKFELLTTLNFLARFEMERRLATLTSPAEPVPMAVLEGSVQKTFQMVEYIRRQALATIGDDLKNYLAALFFCAGGYLATFDPAVRHTRHELVPYLHSLLSAAILCQTLISRPTKDLPLQALNNLWIEERNKEVWVEGRKVTLSSQEFDLLYYLYRHENQLCSRTQIAEQVFGVNFEADMSQMERKRIEESRLNSTMSRLRRKLEPNPDYPKYIIVVRGQGYKLELVDYSV